MWEAIASNQRRSWMLIVLMGLILVGLGGAIGGAVTPARESIVLGAGVAVVVWLVLWLVASAGGDSILLNQAGARKIERDDAPMLWNVVEEMTIAAGLPKMPDVYIIDDPSPNAFAVGRTPEKAAVAVTAGLLKRLDRDELQGVVAHEIGHVRNLDIKFMTLAAVMMGAIVMLADTFLRGMYHSGAGRRRSSSDRNNQGQAVMLIVALVFAILAPLMAQMLYFACSRRREYLADASGARFTRYPEGLARALEKIAGRVVATQGEDRVAGRALAPLYIINPLQAVGASGLFSTHPPTEKRVKILRSMAGAGYGEYEAAWRRIQGEGAEPVIGARTLAEADAAPVRDPSPPSEAPDAEGGIARAREAVRALDRVAGLLIVPCACGLAIKLPAAALQGGGSFACPRCGRPHEPAEGVAPDRAEEMRQAQAAKARDGAAASDAPPRVVHRRGGWETIECACGRRIPLSPRFKQARMNCPACGRGFAFE
jgi:heat shock protein HtpX